MRRENWKSRYLGRELILSNAEAQSIMGKMPKCTAKPELISCVAKRVCHVYIARGVKRPVNSQPVA